MNYYGNSLTVGKKVLLGIIGINVAVFSAWRVSALRNVMLTYFVSSPFGSTLLIICNIMQVLLKL